MNIKIKNYPSKRICEDFDGVIEFLTKYGTKGYNKNWHWARWEWLLGHTSLDESSLPSIGLFMDKNEIVGIVTHDMRDPAYILVNPQYACLKSEMVEYAISNLSHNGISKLFVDHNDTKLVSVVREKGYSLTNNDEYVLELECLEKLSYDLRENFHFTDYLTDQNIDKYVAVIHKGFENKGVPAKGLKNEDFPVKPHENPRLDLFVVAPNGDYAAHCGTWYTPGTEVCYVEPVVTIPEFRGKGLGKAVVYECINRCIEMGAKRAVVISNQEFYYHIGFAKYSVCNLWEKRI